MILAEWIINNQNLLARCSDYTTLIKAEKKGIDLINYVIQNLKENKKQEIDIPLKLTTVLYSHGIGKAFLHESDIYILFYGKDTTNRELEEYLGKLILQRKDIKERIKGLVIGWLDDNLGPVPVFNSTETPETALNMLVSIGMTIVGGGKVFREGLFGPIPVPECPDLETVFYSYLIRSPQSQDSRIVEYGRPIVFFIFFKSGEILAHSASIHIFLDHFFKKILPFEFDSTSYSSLLANLRSLFHDTLDPTFTELEFRTNLVETIYEYHQKIDELKGENEKLRSINIKLKK